GRDDDARSVEGTDLRRYEPGRRRLGWDPSQAARSRRRRPRYRHSRANSRALIPRLCGCEHRGPMRRSWIPAAGLIAMIGPALATAQTASSSAVLTTPHFAFYSDVATNLHDSLITAAVARRSQQPEPFSTGTAKTCFDGLSASDRDGWLPAGDYYTAGKSTRFQRVLQRLELAGLVQRDGLNDSSDRQFLEEAAAVRNAAASAYRQCRWPSQDAVNRRWIDGVAALLAKYETTLGQQL